MVYSSASAFAVVIGIALGVFGFMFPLLISRLKVRAIMDHCVQIGLVAIALSLAILCAAVFACSRIAPDMAPLFGGSVVAAFVICTLGYAVRYMTALRRDESSR